ncbi:jg12709 [Pararge aegeria aegeria]|uniref:Jg12709 protein n=1 Tax=Pararge aegeria aegeria TaxID=348720 RepID=A0A8S4S2R1_9NEOP|nr:jg12709 [Pararge aegeria aegeria]
MAGGVEDDPNLKGLSRYFNSETNRGRANPIDCSCRFRSFLGGCNYIISIAEWLEQKIANSAKATYAVFGVIALYFALKPKAKK